MANSITPPPELVNKWHQEYLDLYSSGDSISRSIYVATQAAQWGADMELEACVKWIEDCGYHPSVPEDFRAARRPEPPTLKEQALTQLTQLVVDLDRAGMRQQASTLEGPIRRALEALPE
jgi:hypothetical protein